MASAAESNILTIGYIPSRSNDTTATYITRYQNGSMLIATLVPFTIIYSLMSNDECSAVAGLA